MFCIVLGYRLYWKRNNVYFCIVLIFACCALDFQQQELNVLCCWTPFIAALSIPHKCGINEVSNQTLFFFSLAFPTALECYSEHMLLCSGNDIKVVFDCLCPSQITKTDFIALHVIKNHSHASLKIKHFTVNWAACLKCSH